MEENAKKISQRTGGSLVDIARSKGSQQTQGNDGLTAEQQNLKDWTKNKLQEQGILPGINQGTQTATTTTLPGITNAKTGIGSTASFNDNNQKLQYIAGNELQGMTVNGVNNTTKPKNIQLPGITLKSESVINKEIDDKYKRIRAENIQLNLIEAQERNKKYGSQVNSEIGTQFEQGARHWWNNVKKAGKGAQSLLIERMAQIGYANGAFGSMGSENAKLRRDEWVEDSRKSNMEYKNKINNAFEKRKKENVNQDLVKEYSGKTFSELARNGDTAGLKYKTIGLFADNISLLPNIIVTAINTPAGLTLMGSDTFIQESQNGFDEMIENGATYEEARNGAFWIGAINAGIEMGGEYLFGIVGPASRGLRNLFTKNVVKEVEKNVYKKTLPEIVYRGGRAQIKSAIGEGGEEGLQEIVNNIFVGMVNDDRGLFDNLRESIEAGGVMGLLIPGGALESVTTDIQTNKKIDLATDIEALNYVMQGEQIKAQRRQQKEAEQKEKIKQKILSRRKAKTWGDVEEIDNKFQKTERENAGFSSRNEYSEGRNIGWEKDEDLSTNSMYISDTTISEDHSHSDMKSSDSFFETDENGEYIEYDDGNRKERIYAGGNKTNKNGSIKSQFTEKSKGTPRTPKLKKYYDNFYRLVKNLSNPNVKVNDYVLIGKTGKGKNIYISKGVLAHIIEDHGVFDVNTLIESVNNPTGQKWESETTKTRQGGHGTRPYMEYDIGSENSEIIVGIKPDSWEKDTDTAEYYGVVSMRESNTPTTPADNVKFQGGLKYEEDDYIPGVASKKEKNISGKEGIKQKNKINDETIEQLAKKYGVKVEVIKGMIKYLENGKRDGESFAYGKYVDDLLTLSEQIKESTAPHELLHAIFDMIDPETKTYLISQVMKTEGWSAGKAEERLADSFSNFFRTGKIEGAPKSTWGRIKIFFKRVRSFINGMNKWRNELEEIFTNIITADGIVDLQSKIDESSRLNKSKERMRKRFMEYRKNAIKMQKKTESENKYQRVYHGSIADFEKFDSTHMGEGEGSQARGYGFYVAFDKDVAKGYAEWIYNNKKFPEEYRLVKNKMDRGMSFDEARNEVMEEIQSDIEEISDSGYKDRLKRQIESLKNMKEDDLNNTNRKRNLYEIEIPDEIKAKTPTGKNYLDYDKKITLAQYEKMKKALSEYGDFTDNYQYNLDYRQRDYARGGRGGELYDRISVILGGDKEASEFLNSIGYDGIKYDGGGDGNSAVIINDEALDIVNHERYQKAGDINSPAFKKRFGDSKVVDKDGNPLVVYHGTRNGGFTSFNKNDSGIRFSEDIDVADSYAGDDNRWTRAEIIKGDKLKDDFNYEGDEGIYKVYLSIKNPLVLDYEGYGATNHPELSAPSYYLENLSDEYDGVIARNIRDEGGWNGGVNDPEERYAENTVYGVKNPNQVKSATDNVGTYDENNDDIRYQKADSDQKDNDGRTLSNGQAEYFKDSKIRDKDGNILVVYHGTRGGDFTVFKGGKTWSNSLAKVGYWFTPSKKGALKFAEGSWGADGKPRAEEVYLNITNPKIYEPSGFNLLSNEEKEKARDEQRKIYNQKADKADGLDYTKAGGFFHDEFDHPYNERAIFEYLKRSWDIDRKYDGKYGKYDPEKYRRLAKDNNVDFDKILKDFEEYTKAKLDEEKEYTKLLDMKYDDPYENFQYDIYKIDSNYDNNWTKADLQMALNDYESPNKFREKLISEGYDGIIIKGTEYDGEVIGGGARNDQYVAFYSNQIKRTTNLNPTDNEDIRYQKADSDQKDNEGRTLSNGQVDHNKNSKIRDKEGNLLRVYHGTNSEYTVYDSSLLGASSGDLGFFGDGWYFATHKGEAGYYGRNIMEGYLNITNPFYYGNMTKIGNKDFGSNAYVTIRNLGKIDESINNMEMNGYKVSEIGDMVDDYLKNVKLEKLNDAKDPYNGWDITYWRVTEYGKSEIQTAMKGLSENGMLDEQLNHYMMDKIGYLKPRDLIEEITDEARFDKTKKSFSQILQDKGYDGIVVGDTAYEADEIVAFRSNEFKNVDNLNPTDNEDIRYQRVYHGTKADFDRFDSSHMGQGEGGQAHGWGHYVAVDKKTGKRYADKQGGILFRGKKRGELPNNMKGTAMYTIMGDIMDGKDKAEAIKDESEYMLTNYLNTLDETYKNTYDYLQTVKPEDFEWNGYLYEVEIPDPVKADTPTGSNYLDEDYTLNDGEAKKMIKELKDWNYEAGKRLEKSYYEENGKSLYLKIENLLGSDKDASEFLNFIGYDGIHYDGRDDGECYVIFNDNALEIKNHEKYQKAGDTNSEAFKKRFDGSKVVNEDGSPKIMYHGTPNKGFTVFKEGYFTENKEYADKYQNPNASSIRFNKKADNPGTYAVYLSIKNPFDTRDPKAKKIFEKEYFGNYGMGTPLGEKGLPDWMDGNDLQEFIMENHPEYDGLILDEGGVFFPNTSSYENDFYGGEVRDRGVSYVPFRANQIKSATDNVGTYDPNNEDIRYQRKDSDGNSLSEGQIKYFENSKIRKDGKLLVVYHGTHGDFTIFDRKKIGSKTNNKGIFGEGFYFTSNKKYGDYYAQPQRSKEYQALEGKTKEDIEKMRGKTMKGYLNITNPFYWRSIKTPNEVKKLIETLGLKKNDLERNSTMNNQMRPITEEKKAIRFRNALEKAGYDGIIYEYDDVDMDGNKQDEIVAFYSNQFKNIDNKNPTYNDDIRFQKAGNTKSANFKKRFDGSKVVKENGKPQIVYHGTTAEFTVFNKIASRGIFGDGYYFTNRIGTARQYGYGRDGRVMKVYLAIKNPYVADNGDGYFLNTEKLKEEGYDGVQVIMGSETYWIAFDSNQIKSATDNVGTYDPNNDDIRYQKTEYEYDENGNRKWIKFGDNSEFDPSIFGTPTKEEQIEEDKEKEKSNPFYNAWIKYNNQNYKDDQITLGEFIDKVGEWGDKKQEEFNKKQNDILEAENDPKMLELQLRAVKLSEEEGNVGKKFGKNVSKEVRDRQQKEVEKKREDLAKDIYEWMYPGLSFEESTYEDQSSAWDKEAEWEMLGRDKIEEKLKYFKKDKNGNWEKKDIKLETPQEQREKIEKSGNFDEIIEPKDRVIQWETPEGQKGRLDKAKDPKQFKKAMEKINSGKSKTKVELKDVTNEVRALERYKENEKAEKERRKKEKQEEYAKKKQEEYKRNVRLKAFQRLVDMQRFEKFPFLTEDEIKQRWGFTDEEWKKITEQQDLGYPPKKRNEKAVSDFNKAVDSEVKFIIEGLSRQNKMKQKEAEKNQGEIGEIDLDVLLGKDEEKGQKEVEEFERIAEEEKKKSKKEKNKRLEQAREDVANVEIDKERENSKSEKERVDKIIKSTKSDNTVWGSIKKTVSDILTPVSTRIREISPKIYRELMRYFQNKDILTNQRLKEIDPFLKAMGKIRKENPVRFMDIWVALANRNIGYANGLLQEYGVKVPTKLLDTIFDEAEDVGLNINYLGSYYPLSVKAPKSFLEELMKVGNGDIASEIEKKIQQESQKKGGPLDESEITAIINSVIAGEEKGPDVNLGNKHMKKRNTEIERTPQMLEYCDDPISTLITYIEGMTDKIERAKFLGKSRSGNVHTLADYVYNAKNGLTAEQQDELMELLKSVFNDASPNKFYQTWRDIATLTTLGSPSSTLTQIGDLSFSIYENGWREALKAVWDIFMKRKAFDLQDMGVVNRGEEYTNINSQKNLLQKAIHNVFKLTFFSNFDTFGKSTFIQSTWNKRRKRALKGENGDPQLIKDIMNITDDEYTTMKIINDLRNGVFSEEVALVMYMKLGNIQPLTKAQMPKAYLDNPNGRLFYQFKTFGIKQLDYVLQETKQQTKGFKNLSTTEKFLRVAQVASMIFIMTLMGAGASELKDITMRRRSNSILLRWLFGEEVGSDQIWDKIGDSALQLFGLSRYTVMQMKSDPVDAITSLFTTFPATNLVTYPFKDIVKAFKNDGSINWRNPSAYQLIPVIGKYRYWIYGGGQDKQQEALDKEKKTTTSGGSSRSSRTTRSTRNSRSRRNTR